MKIDATAAIKRLGIQGPVRFVPSDLRDIAAGAVEVEGCPPPLPGQSYFVPAAVHPCRPYDVLIDEIVLRACASVGDDPAQTIAHELVHVAQFEQLGTDRMALPTLVELMTSEKERGYDSNRFEVEARSLEAELAPLVRVEL